MPPLLCLTILLALVAALLAGKVFLMRRSAREIREKLGERLSADTNTLIDLSGGDRELLRLADSLNDELRLLRAERLRYRSGDRRLKEAVANISHDLRTPLTAIRGYLELLEREELSENAARYRAIIAERTEALALMTEELLRYSLAASEERAPRLEAVELNRALEEHLSAYYAVLLARGIAPEVDLTEARVVRSLDPRALSRVLENIMNNAVKYSGGDLSVTLDEAGTITCANRAPALDSVSVERLFDRFYTVENGGGSTGLGLSIARTLTERMGGGIEAELEGGVLTIRVRFPEGG
ncbi:MAG: HAMP domain-containing histidine kinase [Bacteroides sp.]|nr:HAMP domain-containing histidine kinase [Eubacterium sp.]MCM1419271.1 HAMP domain-containing histidine kinase [Roseburia sp.]MCM1463133.1 HAMP domain-containing histidine kinase [Bacteroides sp.]